MTATPPSDSLKQLTPLQHPAYASLAAQGRNFTEVDQSAEGLTDPGFAWS